MEYRRNLLTREWVIYESETRSPNNLIEQINPFTQTSDLFPNETLPCPCCPESMTTIENILSVNCQSLSPGGIFRHSNNECSDDWDVKVIPAFQPVFSIEMPAISKPRRLHDVMKAPGAHEKIIFSRNHYETLWDLPTQKISLLFNVLQHRMINLANDPKLGHQFAYMVFGDSIGGLQGHSVLNLTASPFIPRKIRQELDGAYQWYRMKERCIFSDIYEEEIYKRDKGQANGIVIESHNFIALIPFFADHPFEIWIMPLDHYGNFTKTPAQHIPELARITSRVMTALRSKLGPFPYVMTLMNQPNENWGAMRGYWKTLSQDWLWQIRIIPHLPRPDSPFKEFNTGTGSSLNPVLPEDAAEYIRSFI